MSVFVFVIFIYNYPPFLLKLKSILFPNKNLFEAQFDDNMKFRQLLMEETKDLSYLRSKPIGRDKQGNFYWFFMDSNYTFRLFAEFDNSDWKIIAK